MRPRATRLLQLTLWIGLAVSQLPLRSGAFALLGPFADWMQPTNGLRLPGDIGGPMELGQEYRWNVPVLTYGFDPSFLDYFGSNGVAAVEEAFQILNDLPPASEIVLSNYALDSKSHNIHALQSDLWDLKSQVLPWLLEQLGLTGPTRNVFVLGKWDDAFGSDYFPATLNPWAFDLGYILLRNYDPTSLIPSWSVNGVLYYGYGRQGQMGWVACQEISEYPGDVIAVCDNAVADAWWGYGLFPGEYYEGLTQDDVGGLRYLLSATNVNFESLPPDVQGSGTNTGSLLRTAWRPGVEKITFVRHPFDAEIGHFSVFRHQYLDNYMTNGVVAQQLVERSTEQPDFLFRAADIRMITHAGEWCLRTGTSNWWNSAKTTVHSAAAGPGVIHPPAIITFHELGLEVNSHDLPSPYGGPPIYLYQWASFADRTNPPVVYPASPPADADQFSICFWLSPPAVAGYQHRWVVQVPYGDRALLQTSTNLTDWATLVAVTNTGTVIDWHHYRVFSEGFFRVVPE